MENRKILKFLESSPTIQELRSFAKSLGLKLRRTMKKRDLVKILKKKAEEIDNGKNETYKEVPSSGTVLKKHEEKHEIHSKPEAYDLPDSYKKDKIVLLPINPQWVYVYWDFSVDTKKKIEKFELKLRLHDVTNIIFDGNNANLTKEASINSYPGNWYFEVDFAGANYVVEIGYYEEGFQRIMISSIISTPRNFPKYGKHETWADLSKSKRRVTPTHMRSSTENAFIGSSRVSSIQGNPSSEEYLKILSKHLSGRLFL
ncbi:MAG: DUF4912 domain-containing protein [Thermotogota bacterium]|nr:DUF4912 domain-containing protein [Thermotogota bacterium]